MLTNYLKIAFCNLWKNKGFSIISISGLATGMAGAMLILLWMLNEVSCGCSLQPLPTLPCT
jgi:hypothetical protein